jgi:dihydrofolate synthase/folylpolyglutamate synthase
MTVGMAFDWFARQSVDIAIIEVGMGGRLDSTNVITPELSIITNIGLDHTFFLGDTLEKIAGEKAGIIKKSVPVIIGKTQKETSPVFDKFANENQSPILYADQTLKLEGIKQKIESITIEKALLDNTMTLSDLETPLSGSYQTENIRTALLAALFLKKEWKITPQHIQNGLKKVIQNTKLQGRWQKLKDNPLTYCDTAHNTEGIELVLHQLKKIPKEKLHFVLGVVNDKNLDAVMKMLPENAQYYFCKADIPRGLNANELMERASDHRLHGKVYPSVKEAYESAIKNASGRDVVFVGGSTFTVAEVL